MISGKIDHETKQKIINDFNEFQKDNSNEYLSFFARKNGTSISIYENKDKTSIKVVFAGANADEFGKKYNIETSIKKNKEHLEDFIDINPQIGSDEVGFGDFFGPIVVVGSYVDKKVIALIREFGIKDSKALNDKRILEIVPHILKKVTYSTLIVNNEKLSKLFSLGYNLNKIKSILHNVVLLNVAKKAPKTDRFFIDQFTPPKRYYTYIKEEKEKITNITFKTHGEDAFPSVALSSVIARYTFLKEIEKLDKKYNIKIPLGASTKVDIFALDFTKKFGITELNKIVKTNFSNYKRLLEKF